MKKICHADTIYPPDTCKWVDQGINGKFIICGSYKLVESSLPTQSSRLGALSLFSFENSSISPVDVVSNISGVLSLSEFDATNFATGLSCGSIALFTLTEKNKINILNKAKISETSQDSELCLCVSPCDPWIWYTTSRGKIGRCVANKAEINSLECYYFKYPIVMWSVISSRHAASVAFASTDDGHILTCDSRVPELQNYFKGHETGICSLSWLKNCELDILCSAGFDPFICLWDIRNTKNPFQKLKTTFSTWNILWFKNNGWACVAAMDAGNILIQIDHFTFSITEHCVYDSPKSLVYSSDVLQSKSKNDPAYFCCTSFYDSTLHIWSFDFPFL